MHIHFSTSKKNEGHKLNQKVRIPEATLFFL